MKTITFYSYKGGVGRSLALSNIAIRLSEFKKKVCILDFDLDAPGLQFKFHDYKHEDIKQGIVDYIYEFSTYKTIPKKLSDFSVILKPSNPYSEPIVLLPAGNISSDTYWKRLTKIEWGNMFYSEEGNGLKFFLDLKAKIVREFNPDFFLIDSRTGITDISGITLKILADEVVLLAANNKENLFGTKKIINSLLHSSITNKIPKLTLLLTRLPFTGSPKDRAKEFTIVAEIKDSLERETSWKNINLLTIHSDRRLEENEKQLIGDDYEQNEVSISNDYLKIFDVLTFDVLNPKEIELFKNTKNAEKEYHKSLLERDHAKQILHLNAAIELNKTRYDFFTKRGSSYYEIGDYAKAEEDFFYAIQLNPNAVGPLISLGHNYLRQNKFEEATTTANTAIDKDPKNENSYWLKAKILQKQGREKDALEILNYVFENITSDKPSFLNFRADVNRVLGNYDQAFQDIFKAIEINPSDPYFYGTLAEIYARTNKLNEFYLNLIIALSKSLPSTAFQGEKEFYVPFLKDKKFVEIMTRNGIDIFEVLGMENAESLQKSQND